MISSLSAPPSPKHLALWRGLVAEQAAVDFLSASGFSILRTNSRHESAEIDIIARQGPLVVVAEVRYRARGSLVGAFASITSTKRARLHRAAQRIWRQVQHDSSIQRVRVDAIAVHFTDHGVELEVSKAVPPPKHWRS